MGTRRNPDGQVATRSSGEERNTPRFSSTSARSPTVRSVTPRILGDHQAEGYLPFGSSVPPRSFRTMRVAIHSEKGSRTTRGATMKRPVHGHKTIMYARAPANAKAKTDNPKTMIAIVHTSRSRSSPKRERASRVNRYRREER